MQMYYFIPIHIQYRHFEIMHMNYCTDRWITSYLQNIGLLNMLLSARFITPTDSQTDWYLLWCLVSSHTWEWKKDVRGQGCSVPPACAPTSNSVCVLLIKCLVICYQSNFVHYLSSIFIYIYINFYIYIFVYLISKCIYWILNVLIGF